MPKCIICGCVTINEVADTVTGCDINAFCCVSCERKINRNSLYGTMCLQEAFNNA